jgi:hypothetical protein
MKASRGQSNLSFKNIPRKKKHLQEESKIPYVVTINNI